LVRLQFRGLPEQARKAFLFENIHDSRGEKFSIPVLVGGLAASEEIYALGLQCRRNEIADRWQKALSHTIKPEVIKTGKVKEVIHRGKALLDHRGLEEFPIPNSTPGFDNAPYITAACWITKDPESGERNMGMYRAQIKGPLRTGIYLTDGNNTAANWAKARAQSKPLEAAAVIGGPVAVAYAAIQTAPYGVDELAIASALVGLDPCRQGGNRRLSGPHDAEIVIEGLIHGCVRQKILWRVMDIRSRTLSPYFEVTAITHRKNYIWVSIISQLTPSESSKTKQAAYEAFCLNYYEITGFRGVHQVRLCEPLLNRQYAVISMNKSNVEPWTPYALLGTRLKPSSLW
jgi:4-hydroxy-3-polyprenylbenzoate decarboxylase